MWSCPQTPGGQFLQDSLGLPAVQPSCNGLERQVSALFSGGDTEARRGQLTWPGTYSQGVTEPALKHRSLAPEPGGGRYLGSDPSSAASVGVGAGELDISRNPSPCSLLPPLHAYCVPDTGRGSGNR